MLCFRQSPASPSQCRPSENEDTCKRRHRSALSAAAIRFQAEEVAESTNFDLDICPAADCMIRRFLPMPPFRELAGSADFRSVSWCIPTWQTRTRRGGGGRPAISGVIIITNALLGIRGGGRTVRVTPRSAWPQSIDLV